MNSNGHSSKPAITLFVDGTGGCWKVEAALAEKHIRYARVERPTGWDRVPSVQIGSEWIYGAPNILAACSAIGAETGVSSPSELA